MAATVSVMDMSIYHDFEVSQWVRIKILVGIAVA